MVDWEFGGFFDKKFVLFLKIDFVVGEKLSDFLSIKRNIFFVMFYFISYYLYIFNEVIL